MLLFKNANLSFNPTIKEIVCRPTIGSQHNFPGCETHNKTTCKQINHLVSLFMSNSNETTVHEGKTFTNINYAEKRLENREFIHCEFVNCDFSRSDLSRNDFMNCRFKQCNFSLTVVTGTGFKEATFTGCKVLGIDFSKCNKFLFSFSFEQCQLDYSTFYGTKLRKTKFTDCSVKETDFEEADLTSSIFHNCDLSGATFVRSVLEKTDFRTARNFSLDPAVNKVKQAKFSAMNLSGLLYQYQLDIDYNGH